MLAHKVFRFALSVVLGSILLNSAIGTNPVYAGAPYQPELVSPPNGAMADTNPPTLCARNKGDPQGYAVFIRFEAWGGGEAGGHVSPWLPAGAVDNVVCWKDTGIWTAQNHSWQARAMNSNGEQAGATPEWGINIPPPPTATPTCTIDTLSVSPTAPQAVGTIISITSGASCTNGVQSLRFKVDGVELQTVSSSFATISWNTNGLSPIDHVITVEAADNVGGYVQTRSHTYTLTLGAPPPTPVVTCSITSFNISPSSPQVAGTQVSISVNASCDTSVRAIRILVDGGNVSPAEIGVPAINSTWDTSGLNEGSYTITLQAAGLGDNNWSQAASESLTFTLGSAAPPPTSLPSSTPIPFPTSTNPTPTRTPTKSSTIVPAPINRAPYQPTLFSPANGATVNLSNLTLCAINNGDPDGNSVSIRFEVTGGGEADKVSPWLAAGVPGTKVCWKTSALTFQTHAWQARAKDSRGVQSGATSQWLIKIEPLTAIGAWFRYNLRDLENRIRRSRNVGDLRRILPSLIPQHIACAVFSIPNEAVSTLRYSAWFQASDGTKIYAGYYAEGAGLEGQFNVTTPPGGYLYGVCVSTTYFTLDLLKHLEPRQNPLDAVIFRYGTQFSQRERWHMYIMPTR